MPDMTYARFLQLRKLADEWRARHGANPINATASCLDAAVALDEALDEIDRVHGSFVPRSKR